MYSILLKVPLAAHMRPQVKLIFASPVAFVVNKIIIFVVDIFPVKNYSEHTYVVTEKKKNTSYLRFAAKGPV